MVTANAIQEFKEMLANTTTDLQDYLENLNNKLEALSVQGSHIAKNDTAEKSLREDIDSIKDCLALCARASRDADKVRTNVFEDVSAARNAHQIIVSTLDDLISAKRVTAGVDAKQWLGQMSDATVRALARSHGVDLDRVHKTTGDVQEQGGGIKSFEDQYGSGHKLG